MYNTFTTFLFYNLQFTFYLEHDTDDRMWNNMFFCFNKLAFFSVIQSCSLTSNINHSLHQVVMITIVAIIIVSTVHSK